MISRSREALFATRTQREKNPLIEDKRGIFLPKTFHLPIQPSLIDIGSMEEKKF